MNNKIFWPIVLIAVVIIAESVLLLTGGQDQKTKTVVTDTTTVPTEEVIEENAVDFEWLNETTGKVVLVMKANKAVSIDAIDLYIAYKNMEVNSVKNLDELTEPTFSKISTEKSLVVMNYLIPEPEGFKMSEGQSVRITELDVTANSMEPAELSIDSKTQVVENGTFKVLPFNSVDLIINAAL